MNCWSVGSICLPATASGNQALQMGGCFFQVSAWGLKNTRMTRTWSAAGLRTLSVPGFPGTVSRNRYVPLCFGSPFSQAGRRRGDLFPAPQPGLLLTTAQLTPIQAADTYFQGVSELRYLWMPFCVVPLALAQPVPSLFQQLLNDWGDRLQTRHGLWAGPQWGQSETASILVDLPPFSSFTCLYSVFSFCSPRAQSRDCLVKNTHTHF